MMRSRGRPAFTAASWSCFVRAMSAVLVVTFLPKRITPPIWPLAIRLSRLALGVVVPSMATTSFWPMSWATVGPAATVVPAAGPVMAATASARTRAKGRGGGPPASCLRPGVHLHFRRLTRAVAGRDGVVGGAQWRCAQSTVADLERDRHWRCHGRRADVAGLHERGQLLPGLHGQVRTGMDLARVGQCPVRSVDEPLAHERR